MNLALIITAAGKGTRFGPEGKITQPLNGKPLLIQTCLAFENTYPFHSKLITVEAEKKDAFQTLLLAHNLQGYEIVIGGSTRKQSVENAFNTLNSEVDSVMIHDGARPWISPDLITRLIEAAQTHPAVIPVLPVTDTVKKIVDNTVIETVDRSCLYRVQTPQVFHRDALKKAYALGINNATDESFLFEQAGFPVTTVEGDWANVKVTVTSDLK